MRIGIDLGGTKIEGIALDDQGEVLMRHRLSTPSGNYAATLDSIAALVEHIESSTRQTATVGIGTPGSLSPASQLLRNSNSVCMNGKAVKTDIETRLGREVRITNDANCFALSEATDGAAAGAQSVFGVIVGTGTGAGIVINGQVHLGANAIAGEWGHNPLPWPQDDERPGAACFCGRQGCIETFLSGPGLSADYLHLSGQKHSAEEIVELSSRDMLAEKCLQRYEHRMARALAHVINILDPEVIVLGGGLSNIQRLYQTVPALWSGFIFSDVVNTRLVAPRYGDSSGVRGAAWLWNE